MRCRMLSARCEKMSTIARSVSIWLKVGNVEYAVTGVVMRPSFASSNNHET